ncbi:DUF3850 domain-containing protein [Synergistes jonesii]|uniref:DUF3850 domain-containing protein n=1 Tax=Synergistes jonesii TaxID=2754 RepID=A0A073INH5_9BACT|nr:DUF3850 domain-containing protein [Synergistes jonesii]KEJ91115.1 hypothetical protein EH55_13125 [Synergistes jonesii]
MQQTHHLKLDKYYWDAVKSGDKPFEVRKNDRGFQKGDVLCFHKYDCSEPNNARHLTFMIGGGDKCVNVIFTVIGPFTLKHISP